MLTVRDSVAVITGGSGGIGRTLAEYWLKEGGKVVIADVQEGPLRAAESELHAISGNVAALLCDVTKEEDNSRLAELAIERFGAINLVAPFAGITGDGLLIKTDRDTGKVVARCRWPSFRRLSTST